MLYKIFVKKDPSIVGQQAAQSEEKKSSEFDELDPDIRAARDKYV